MRLHGAMVFVKDLERMKRFYGQKLAMRSILRGTSFS
jgi:catechol 2,3-dioxygenase-like lactoylglutathione lyase family enzyme